MLDKFSEPPKFSNSINVQGNPSEIVISFFYTEAIETKSPEETQQTHYLTRIALSRQGAQNLIDAIHRMMNL